MSYLSVSCEGLNVQFYCQNCYDDEEEESVVLPWSGVISDGMPDCDLCGDEMIADFILVPPVDAPEHNHI